MNAKEQMDAEVRRYLEEMELSSQDNYQRAMRQVKVWLYEHGNPASDVRAKYFIKTVIVPRYGSRGIYWYESRWKHDALILIEAHRLSGLTEEEVQAMLALDALNG